MSTLEDIVQRSQQHVRYADPSSSVFEAVDAMREHHVRALLVGTAADPVGIFCECDVLERVVLGRRDPDRTRVGEVMTAPLVFLPADASASEALDYLRQNRVHQVPILGEESVVGIVSSSDLMRWALDERDRELYSMRSYVSGWYSTATLESAGDDSDVPTKAGHG